MSLRRIICSRSLEIFCKILEEETMVSSSGDVFSEVLVKRKTTTGNIIVRVICGIVTLIIAALFVLGFFAALPGLFIFAVVILVIEYFIIRFQKVEYEYIFTSGDLDFDQLSGDFRRKRKLSVTFEALEVIAPEGSHWLDGYQHGDMKVYDFSSRDKSKKRYVYVGGSDNGRIKVIFEPSEKMVKNMFNYSPSKVKMSE